MPIHHIIIGMRTSPTNFVVRALVLIAVLAASLAQAAPAFAAPGDCDDPTAGIHNSTVVCAIDPFTPDAVVGLDLGDDTYTQNSGVTTDSVSGDGLDDGTEATGNGGNDSITINGTVDFCVDGDNVDGDGGNDTIVINGHVVCVVSGDYADGDGGNDRIIVNGTVDSDVVGDDAGGDGGDDSITINGHVGGDVYGDEASGDGGSDTIVINGTVDGDVYGDDLGVGGDDHLIIGEDAEIDGTIYGDDGYDILEFRAIRQSVLDGLDPASGSITIGGITYFWQDFEQLIGYLEQLGFRALFSRNGIIAVDVFDGIKVYNGDSLVAFVAFSALKDLQPGAAGLVLQSAAHSEGWYVVVENLGTTDAHTGNHQFQVSIFNVAGGLAGQFTFSN